MQYSTNYNLNLVEGTDIVNPLVIDKPNYQTIDAAMKANKDASVNSASHTKAGTVHAIVRSNTDANTFRFVASAPFVAGDTFTVDGNAVTGINTAGEGLETNDFVIGASVLCVLNSGTLTLNVNKKVSIPATYDAADIVFDNTGTGLTATNAQDAIEEINTNVSKNTLGTAVDISSYTNTPYQTPSDGYVQLIANVNGDYALIQIGNYSGGVFTPMITQNVARLSVHNAPVRNVIYIKKGMYLLQTGLSGTAEIKFIPTA